MWKLKWYGPQHVPLLADQLDSGPYALAAAGEKKEMVAIYDILTEETKSNSLYLLIDMQTRHITARILDDEGLPDPNSEYHGYVLVHEDGSFIGTFHEGKMEAQLVERLTTFDFYMKAQVDSEEAVGLREQQQLEGAKG